MVYNIIRFLFAHHSNDLCVTKLEIMKTNKEALADDTRYVNKDIHGAPFTKDIVLNLNFTESIIRCLTGILVPLPFLLIDPLLMGTVAAPIMFYVFITGFIHFCPIRYAYQHWVKHIATLVKCQFSVDLNIPIKAV